MSQSLASEGWVVMGIALMLYTGGAVSEQIGWAWRCRRVLAPLKVSRYVRLQWISAGCGCGVCALGSLPVLRDIAPLW
jgi:hypothetical protein